MLCHSEEWFRTPEILMQTVPADTKLCIWPICGQRKSEGYFVASRADAWYRARVTDVVASTTAAEKKMWLAFQQKLEHRRMSGEDGVTRRKILCVALTMEWLC